MEAHMKTNKGTIKLNLFYNEAPVTVSNFVNLSNRGYYNDISFHLVIDKIKLDKPQTRDFLIILDKLNLKQKKVTFLVNELEENTWLSSRNLYKINVISVDAASTYDLIDCDILVLDKLAVTYLNKNLAS